MFTKNLTGSEHNKHAARLCGCSKYCSTAWDVESYEWGSVSRVTEHHSIISAKAAGVKTQVIRVSAVGIK